MATRRKSSRSRSSTKKRSAFSGVFLGIIIGLGVAIGVAIYLNNNPFVFQDKASRTPITRVAPSQADTTRQIQPPPFALHDNTAPLYGDESTAPAIATTPTAPTPPRTAPDPARNEAEPDALGSLIASLPERRAAPAAPSAPTSPPTVAPSPTTKASTPAAAPNVPKQKQNSTYYLQAGAFRSANDAEATKARILMLGMQAEVHVGELQGSAINRVRVGPFTGTDALNNARTRLSDEKIATSVVAAP